MSFSPAPESSSGGGQSVPAKRRHLRPTRRVFFWAACLGLFLTLLSVLSGFIDSPLAYAVPLPATIHLKGAPSHPNTLSPTAGSTSLTRTYTPAPMGSQPPHEPQTIQRNVQVPMQPGSVALSATKATRFVGSDGRLELLIPVGAVTTQDLSDAGGTITLKVTQIAPASGSNAGGSGHLSLGTYLLQLVDAKGVLLSHGLRKALTARFHLHANERGLGLSHAYVVFNGALSAGTTKLKGVVQPAASTSLASTMGTLQHQNSALDPKALTLSVTPLLNTPSTSLSWNGDAPISTFGKPDPFSTDLSSGGLTAGEPITVPAGPGGLTPPVNLTYSSESVNGQHSYSSAAGWVGEGWNLSLGEITWNQHNVVAGCTPQPTCGTNWQNQWFLNDPFGTSSELIPPTFMTSTYYDASSNVSCSQPNPTEPCPTLWHTATESHAKIYAYVGPLTIPSETINPPCWRVWLPNGIMEEFGCTSDSLQYFYVSGGHAEVSGWFLDLITDPQGNQIHLTYQRDMASWKDPSTGTTYSYPRDVELQNIQYDSPGCLNAQSLCTGGSWAPLMQVVFNASHSPSIRTNGTPSGCNTGSNLRCDDPLDLSGSGGTAAPLVQNTYVLNSIQVQVRTSGTGSWNTLDTYKLGYEQSGPSQITDPASGMPASVAGMLDLTRLQEVGSTGASALLYSGKDNSSTTSYAYMKVFDVSTQNILIGPNTTLSYWIFPQSSATNNLVSGSNSTCVAIDMIFSDGSDLRDSGAVDQHGNQLHPAHQCGKLTLDQWNLVTSDIGAKVSGKTLNRIDVGYDQPANTGGYRGYIDDIVLSDPTSSTPLFATDLESGSAQPTWTNTIDTTGGGNSSNIGGICCSLTGPELWSGGQDTIHADSAALPSLTFSYTTQTNYYEDSYFHPNPSTNCGPSWNTGNGSGCLLWEQSYANNNHYLSAVSNGQGLAQSFSWQLARNNSHGVPGGGSNNADPFYCDAHQSTSPCQEVDDSGWSHVVLSSESSTTVRLTQTGQGGTQTSTPITETTTYSYQLTYPLPAQQCSDCVAGMYWGDQNNNNYLNYYDGTFMGFAQTTVNQPDGGVTVHKFYAGEGWGIYDPNEVTCATPNPCHKDPWWDLANAAHGHEYQTLTYDRDGSTLLSEVDTTYTATCPPTGVSPTPPKGSITWDGMLISDLDHNNPVVVCDIHPSEQVHKTYDGASNPLTTTTDDTYDSYGRVTQETTTSNGGTPTEIVKKTWYVWNDSITATTTSASGTYLINFPAFTATEDGSGNRLQCGYVDYDGPTYASGQTSTLTKGLATNKGAYTDCGTAANNYDATGLVSTVTSYDASGNVIGSDDADADADISGHTGCTVGSTQYTTCTTYDSTFKVFSTAASNALNQTNSTSYSNATALFGYGTWPMSTTDANAQTTSYTYDALGRMTGETLPGETSGEQTKQWVYTNWCSGTAAQAPCEEIDEIDRLDSTTAVTTRGFYDGEGHLVETRIPGINGQDIITYAYYDTSGRKIFKSNAYFVPAYNGASGAAAYSIPDSTQPGTTTNYAPNAGITTLRTTSVTDPNSYTTTTTDSVICGVSGTNDTGCYVQGMVVDANGHERASLTGGLSKTNYTQTYTGTSGSYVLYATTTMTYDAAGRLLSTKSPDGSTATAIYDDLGRAISQTDPDRGTMTLTYDPNGNLTESADARGSAGTVFTGYDGLNRPLWRNSTNNSTGAWVTFAYDSTANGNDGVGHVTGETFTGSGGLSGAYAYTYDGRGQQVGETVTVNGSNYVVLTTYNDNGQIGSQTYPTGEIVTPGYGANGWLTSLNTKIGSTTTTLASNLAYSGLAGAAGQITTMDYGNGDIYTASYDTGLRLTSASLTRASDNTLLYQTQPAYDAVNNVVSVQTSIAGATDAQQFCYDEFNRLTWAGATGIPPCASLIPGTLTAAQYQQSDTYNVDNGLTSESAGNYTYGDSSHPHAVTSFSNSYSAAYDAAGNMICRSLTSATTCSGTQTGQQLSYDAQGRLSSWENQPTSPNQTANYLYDGSGNRVAMLITVNGTTTLTTYIGSIEEVQTTGSSTITTTYYAVQGKRIAANVNGSLYYFGYDALGSQIVVLNSSGNLVGSQLYGPYGSSRYTNGTLPTSIGFTGQQSDSITGLDYYNARYYDPAVSQFLSADTVQGNLQGMNPYTYVLDNPETRTDPTGHRFTPGTPWYYYDDDGNQVSRPRTNFPVYRGSSTDPTSYGADAVARELAREVKAARLEGGGQGKKSATENRDWAGAEWYITAPDGTRIDGGFLGVVSSIPGDGGAHAERQLLEKFFEDLGSRVIETLGSRVIGELLDAYAADQFATMLHVVLFTQYPPCSTCANTIFPTFMAAMAQEMNTEMIARMIHSPDLLDGGGDPMVDAEDPFPVMTLDVYGSTFVPSGNDWTHVFNPGTTDTYGVTDYWSDEVTYTPLNSGFGYGE
ncbi:MAG TPA: RHS repeat-associated core domain-containing protein [Ktedonobacteraceae bacterium]|nr:RHS repeat-associated core domain-containing protein [Ktedonobacteraceae bacterium]